MANPPTWIDVEQRIRHRILEEGGADFWDQDELMRGYDEGCQMQHEIAIETAFATNRARAAQHPYLRRFYTMTEDTLDAAVFDRNVDADVYRMIDILILASPPFRAIWKDPGEDRYLRLYPNLQPDYGEAFWTVTGRATALPRYRIYVRGDGPLNNVASTPFEKHYYRNLVRMLSASPPLSSVDVIDPYNEGPVTYSAAKALAKQRTDPQPLFAEALIQMKAAVPMPPQAAQ